MNLEKTFRMLRKNWKLGKYRRLLQNAGLCAATACIVLLLVYFVRGREAEKEIEALRALKNQAAAESPAALPKLDGREVSGEYQELFLKNPDLVAWLTIDGTKIDYPVMWTPEDPEFYSHRGFDKKDSQNGLLFLDKGSRINEYGGNLIVYGHNMKNGSMFADLLRYGKKSYWEGHKSIQLDTLQESRRYEIFAAGKSGDPKALPYGFTTASEKECRAALEGMQALSLYDTGEKGNWGDDFLTLSTCDYSTKDGRFVVMARRVK